MSADAPPDSLEAKSPFELRVNQSAGVQESFVKKSIETGDVGFLHSFTTGSAVDGPGVRVVPVLCGPFVHGMESGRPEDHEEVARFVDGLARLARRERGRLMWVLGVDLAHVGRRYGDAFDARAARGRLEEVAERDLARLARVVDGDGQGLWEDVRARGEDTLRWCGASPVAIRRPWAISHAPTPMMRVSGSAT